MLLPNSVRLVHRFPFSFLFLKNHRSIAQSVGKLFHISGDKAQMPVYLHRIRGGIDCKALYRIVLAHGFKQTPADTPAVICGIHEEIRDVLRRTHAQNTHQPGFIKGAVEAQVPDDRGQPFFR